MNTSIARATRLASIAILIGTLNAAGPTVAQSSSDMVLDWNATTLKTTAAAAFNPPLESRNVAIVHASMFDAVNSILGEFQRYAIEVNAPPGSSPDAAAAAAAHFALAHLYPAPAGDARCCIL